MILLNKNDNLNMDFSSRMAVNMKICLMKLCFMGFPSPKNLDPSCKLDQDFWVCFGRDLDPSCKMDINFGDFFGRDLDPFCKTNLDFGDF